uniref:Securin n=1 Tax=Saimiri boliviensis boliviensis TaxID=39432 RepID=A0A2K6URM6_SAIBB
MASLIYVDTENGETGTRVAAKDGLKLGSGPSVKALNGRSQVATPRFGKTFDAPPALPKATRKALGTVNRATEKAVKTSGPLNQKQPRFSAKKITGKTVKAKNDAYPEIEKLFPFNLLDFESFDLPEEHQIAHLPLTVSAGPPSPVKMPSPPWESNLLRSSSSILLTLDIELPPICYDIDI